MNISPRDWEALSAYLDGQLPLKKQTRLEARLEVEPELGEALEELRRTREVLRKLPRLRAPRNFTLTPAVVGKVHQHHPLFPTFRLASALASLLLVLVIIGDFMGLGGISPQVDQVLAPVQVEVAMEKASEPVSEDSLAEEAELLAGDVETEYPMAEAPMPEEMVKEAESEELASGMGELESPREPSEGVLMAEGEVPVTDAVEEARTPAEGTEVAVLEMTPIAAEAEEVAYPPAEETALVVSEPETTPTSEPEPTEMPAQTADVTDTQRGGLSILRITEISLALIAVCLGLGAIYLRQRGGV